ncbi:MAG: class II aldolase/adducin family protein [Acidobacteriia bacterium]|nr:class II aldolase/adducin family protein [Terriglobia bacterium]
MEQGTIKNVSVNDDLGPLLDLAGRVGHNPLLTQASTGNISLKLDGVLWIKASGKWLADATGGKILTPLDLAAVRASIRQNLDPAELYPNASIETAMHVTLPHAVVLHVHSVNTIAWAVREDAANQLATRLDGLRWQWIPYVASGIPLAREIERVLTARPETDVLVLGNHGLVLGGKDCQATETLLAEIERRLAIPPRQAHPADYALLSELALDSLWDLPDDDAIHALATDPVSRKILEGGFLYPCQAMFSDARTPELFHAATDTVPDSAAYAGRPFVIVKGLGVVLSRTMTPAEIAMLSGLAQVVQRIDPSTPLRYLTEGELAESASIAAYRYRELANASHA